MDLALRLAQRIIWGLALVGLVASSTSCGEGLQPALDVDRQPDLLLVTFCTLRADRIGVYGGGDLTPAIDALAREGIVFRNHYTQASYSGGAFASIITGQYCFRHGIYDHPKRLADESLTLAERFRQSGYATAGFLSHAYLRPKWNYLQGLDLYNGRDLTRVDPSALPKPAVGTPAEQVSGALEWVDQLGDRPFFLWYQTQLSHFFPRAEPPWVAEEELASAQAFRSRIAGQPPAAMMFGFDRLEVSPEEELGLRAVYDGAVARTDDLLGRLIEGLKARGRFDNTIVVVTADHGEAIGEGGIYFNHDSNMLEPTVRVPFILKAPGARPAEVEVTTRNIDLFPTLGDLAGLDVSSEIDGQSLVPLMAGETVNGPVFSETRPKVAKRQGFDRYRLRVPKIPGKIRMVRQDNLKLILYPKPDGYDLELYDLAADPTETTNLAAKRPDVAKGLAWRLEEWFAGYRNADVQPLKLDEEDLESLRALGYID